MAEREMPSRQEQLIQEFELKRRAQAIIVPTNDGAVRDQLRSLGEPITLFGEREPERRDRLRSLLAKLDAEGKGLATTATEEVTEVPVAELFYTEGTEGLLDHRRWLATYSLKRASERVRRLNEEQESIKSTSQVWLDKAREIAEDYSEFGDDRPLSDCCISFDGQILSTASWSGTYKLWSLENCKKLLTVRAHNDRITGMALHPHNCIGDGAGGLTTSSTPADVVQVATACSDGTAKLWSASGQALHTLEGHTDRCARTGFHPSGRSLGTASFDHTWRLWDVETGSCLLEQEGHSRPVYAVAFQCDGSLAVSCGLDAIGRVWDLRTGKCIRTLRGHVKSILGADFAPNGHQIATGSDDHSCKIWDLRMSPNRMSEMALYTIAAHQSLLSKVKFEAENGAILVTASYDKTVKLWSGSDFSLLSVLRGHESRVMGADIGPRQTDQVVSVSYDRTIKVWKMKGQQQRHEEEATNTQNGSVIATSDVVMGDV